ncbi:hypothetical protein C8F01DRAFT_1364191 [Mycena amicta]|nr:hypothetical protein C8F01DRAFT_1364191 [Mycena amicta]
MSLSASLSPIDTMPSKEIREVHMRLKDIDDEIAGTLAHVERLKVRRMDVLVDLNRVSSPFMKLPPELICEIFLFSLPSRITCTHVCHQWREIAVSLSALWSSISVSEILHCYFPKPQLLEMLQTFLTRAANTPLSMSLAQRNPIIPQQPMFDGSRRSELFRVARHSSARWRELDIVRPLSDMPLLLQRDEPWDLPQLVKLTILLTQGTRPERMTVKMSNLTEAPALREVHLMGFSPSSLLLPWWQLTTIRIENLHPVEVLDTLSCATSVVDASFSIWPAPFFRLPRSDDIPTGRPRALKSLTITGENHITPLLDHLLLYPFKKFSIAFGPNNEFAPVIQFLASFPSLSEISIQFAAAISMPDLGACLEQMARVQVLTLGVHNGLMNSVLPQALATNSDLLPALKSLTIHEHVDRYHEPPVNTALIAEMLRARWADGHGLKEFTLVTSYAFFSQADLMQFVDFARAGMKIKVQSHGTGPFMTMHFDSAWV